VAEAATHLSRGRGVFALQSAEGDYSAKQSAKGDDLAKLQCHIRILPGMGKIKLTADNSEWAPVESETTTTTQP